MKLILTLITTASLLAVSSAVATTATITAQRATGVSNLAGTALSGTQVDLGHYDDNTNTFTPLAASVATTAAGSLPNGLYGGAALVDSSALGSAQPAIRIVSDGGSSVIAYSTGWTFTSGDGTGTDTGTDYFYLEDVVTGGALTDMNANVVASPGSQFVLNGTNNGTLGTPSLAIGPFLAPSNLDSDNANDGDPTGSTTHTFTWTAPASSSTITEYSYELKDIPGGNVVNSGSTTDTLNPSATLTGLIPGTYNFEVTAIADNGTSEAATFNLVIDSNLVIPTMTEWGIILLVATMLLVALRRMQAEAV